MCHVLYNANVNAATVTLWNEIDLAVRTPVGQENVISKSDVYALVG